MTITIQDFAQALYLALQETADSDHDRIIENLIKELEMENRLHEFAEIVEELERLLEIEEGELKTQTVLGQVATANAKLINELNAKAKTQNISTKEENIFIAVE